MKDPAVVMEFAFERLFALWLLTTPRVWIHRRVVPAVLTAAIATLLLWGGYLRLDSIAAAKNDDGEVEAAAAMLILFPALLTTYLLRPGEHELVASILLLPRVMLLGIGMAVVVAAGLVVTELEKQLELVWAVNAGVAALGFLGLLVSYFSS